MPYPEEVPLSRRAFVASIMAAGVRAAEDAAPIVVLAAEGHGAHLSTLGTAGLRTPRLDALAEQGTLYTRAYAVAPITAAAEHTFAVEEPAAAYAKAAEVFPAKPAVTLVRIARELRFANARRAVDPAEVELPGALPDLPGFRARWVRYLNYVQCVDAAAGAVLDALERSPMAEAARVVYTSTSGYPHAPLHELALRVPLIVAGPGAVPSARRRELVAADPFGPIAPKEFLTAHNDKSHCLFNERYRLIRHREPGLRPETDPELAAARERFPQHWRVANASLPPEEFYDLAVDPFEMRNLAFDNAYAQERERMAKLMPFAVR